MDRGRWLGGGALLLLPWAPGGKPTPQPAVPQGLRRGHPDGGVPLQTPLEEVEQEGVIAALEGLAQLLAPGRSPYLTPLGASRPVLDRPIRIGGNGAVPRVVAGAEEGAGALAGVQELLRRHAQDLHGAGQLVRLVFPGKERVTGEELGQDASEAPHVDGHAVLPAQDDLRGAIEAALDVGVDALVVIAA